jgi:hypothetical protein
MGFNFVNHECQRLLCYSSNNFFKSVITGHNSIFLIDVNTHSLKIFFQKNIPYGIEKVLRQPPLCPQSGFSIERCLQKGGLIKTKKPLSGKEEACNGFHL